VLHLDVISCSLQSRPSSCARHYFFLHNFIAKQASDVLHIDMEQRMRSVVGGYRSASTAYASFLNITSEIPDVCDIAMLSATSDVASSTKWPTTVFYLPTCICTFRSEYRIHVVKSSCQRRQSFLLLNAA
jgi:hypothetical protein